MESEGGIEKMSEVVKSNFLKSLAVGLSVLLLGSVLYSVRWGGQTERELDVNREVIRVNLGRIDELQRGAAKADGIQQSNLRRLDSLEILANDNLKFREKYFQELERRLTTMEGTIKSAAEKLDLLLKRP